MQGLEGDLRYAARTLSRSPGFTVVAVLSLALAIGANAAVFGVVRSLLVRGLPVESPNELAILGWQRDGDYSISQMGSTDYEDPSSGARLRSNFAFAQFEAMSASLTPEARLFAFHLVRSVSVGVGEGAPVLGGGALASGGYFSTLGVPMALGRGFGPDDDRPGAPLVTVLGHAMWVRSFGADPDIVGRTIRVNGQPAEVIGVTAPGFVGLSMGGFFPQTDVTIPLASRPLLLPEYGAVETDASLHWLRLMVRTPAGVGDDGLRSGLTNAFAATPSPEMETGEGPVTLGLVDGSRGAQPIRGNTSTLIWLMQAVVGVVLLIACVNLASLMFGRGVARQREMAVRRALGGPRARLVRQQLMESVVIAGLGTGLGLLLALGSRGLLAGLIVRSVGSGDYRPSDLAIHLDPLVIALTASAGLATTLLFGLLPALRLGGVDPVEWLKQRGSASGPKLRVGRALIALQVAISLPLVVGALLLIRTVSNLAEIELGFEPQGVVAFQVNPDFTDRPEEEHGAMYRSAVDEVSRVPGVRVASIISHPLVGGIISNGSVLIDGERSPMYFNPVGPAFTEALGLRIVAGRAIGIQDGPESEPVALLNETAARAYFGGAAEAIDRFVERSGRPVRIVGVISDTPYRNLRDDIPPVLHESAFQVPGYRGHHLLVRIEGDRRAVYAGLEEALRRVDPQLPAPEFIDQAELVQASTSRERTLTGLLGLFGAFALLLASIGLHGVTAYAVTRRTNELGLRIAVGATPVDILRLVLRQVATLTAAGLLIGVPIALSAVGVLESVLFDVAPGDPFTLGMAAAVLLVVAVGAGLLPGLRAARMDALEALRAE